uniref:NAD(P)-binding domain-containing protein n=1 Tax=Alexandrium monilatum TaxID=311494 RepID=A0A7S4RVI4_9DINO
MARSLHAFCFLCAWAAAAGDVLVTGATGRTGSLLYKALKESGTLGRTRALVRNVTQARERLSCNACDPSEGIFVGDVTDPASLGPAFSGVKALAIAVGVFSTEQESIVKAVEWEGVKHQVAALLEGGAAGKRVALISSMGTTDPPSGKSNHVMFWKLKAEALLASTGVAYSVVKPCGLSNSPGGERELMVGHDDEEPWFSEGFYMIPRADVANITAAALTKPPAGAMRFDLCAKAPGSGPPAPSGRLLEEALLPWQRHRGVASTARGSELWV